MPKLPRVNQAGFQIVRQVKHIIMSNGQRRVVIPRNNPVNAYTMAIIVSDAGLTIEQFLKFI